MDMTLVRFTTRWMAAVVGAWLLAGCHGLLDVSDPTLIQDSDIANAAGANAQRLNVVNAFNTAAGQVFSSVALFTDERMFDAPSLTDGIGNANFALDVRDTALYQSFYGNYSDPHLGPLTSILAAAAVALPGIRLYAADSVRGDYLAQIYAFRGFAVLQMAEDLCPGFPINEVRGGEPYYSAPFSTDSAFRYAIALLDTALADGRDSVRFLNFARVLKGRALTDLGEYDSASAAVALVPTDFVYDTDVGVSSALDAGFFGGVAYYPLSVGNREGGVGLSFASAQDPRVPSVFRQMRYQLTTDTVSDSLRDQVKYVPGVSPVPVASGVEARLIEAEAALNAGDSGTWLATLNALRDVAIDPAMPHLADPGPATRLDTLFKERAFWLYLTGHRLGDMRRLIHRYGRADTTVFAHGTHPLGVVYDQATSIPFIFANASQYNPHITQGCAREP